MIKLKRLGRDGSKVIRASDGGNQIAWIQEEAEVAKRIFRIGLDCFCVHEDAENHTCIPSGSVARAILQQNCAVKFTLELRSIFLASRMFHVDSATLAEKASP